MPRAWLSTIALTAAVALPAVAALAQQDQPPDAAHAAKGVPHGADAGLQRRVEQLEEQLVDMQVLVGTLESLARGVPPPSGGQLPNAPALSVSDAGRLDALETQIRALAAQLENLQAQVRSLGDRPGTPAGGFGAVTVAPAAPKDALDRVFPGSSSSTAPPPSPAGAEAATPPQQLYERAYGYLLQKDYGTAEAAFEDFLKHHPDHPLAGNAQYWLGETYYVRGQYRPAAAAYLKGYREYSKSQKAPESLLKLAMSLQRLGQKDAACSSYTELAAKFPDAPDHIQKRAMTERQRGGC